MRRLTVVLAMLMACGGDDDGGPVEIDELPGAILSAYCNLYVNCGLIDDYATCRTLDLDADIDPELLAAVKAGLVHYDEGQAGVCIGGISSTSCERGSTLTEPDACDLVFTGTLGAGAECAIDEECISNACDVPSCPDACCKGTCVGDTSSPPRPHLGESCATDSRCVDSWCDTGTQTCLARKPLGSTCEDTDECELGVCVGTCTQLPGPGDTCNIGPELPCAQIGYTCSAATNTCVPLGLTGDACTTRADCSPIYDCTGGSCVLGPTIGDSCADRGCIDNSFCSDATSLCTAPQADGAPCMANSECVGDCDATTNTCVTNPVCI